jgi:hypothetical protein
MRVGYIYINTIIYLHRGLHVHKHVFGFQKFFKSQGTTLASQTTFFDSTKGCGDTNNNPFIDAHNAALQSLRKNPIQTEPVCEWG